MLGVITEQAQVVRSLMRSMGSLPVPLCPSWLKILTSSTTKDTKAQEGNANNH